MPRMLRKVRDVVAERKVTPQIIGRRRRQALSAMA